MAEVFNANAVVGSPRSFPYILSIPMLTKSRGRGAFDVVGGLLGPFSPLSLCSMQASREVANNLSHSLQGSAACIHLPQRPTIIVDKA